MFLRTPFQSRNAKSPIIYDATNFLVSPITIVSYKIKDMKYSLCSSSPIYILIGNDLYLYCVFIWWTLPQFHSNIKCSFLYQIECTCNMSGRNSMVFVGNCNVYNAF